MAIDPSTDDAFWNHGTNIAATKFTEPYNEQPPFEILPGLNSAAMEFSGDGQTLFATEAGSTINIFKRQLPEAPEAIGPVGFEKVKSESALVSGVVDTGGGGPATYYFEYGLDTSYGHRYPPPTTPFPTPPSACRTSPGCSAGSNRARPTTSATSSPTPPAPTRATTRSSRRCPRR